MTKVINNTDYKSNEYLTIQNPIMESIKISCGNKSKDKLVELLRDLINTAVKHDQLQRNTFITDEMEMVIGKWQYDDGLNEEQRRATHDLNALIKYRHPEFKGNFTFFELKLCYDIKQLDTNITKVGLKKSDNKTELWILCKNEEYDKDFSVYMQAIRKVNEFYDSQKYEVDTIYREEANATEDVKNFLFAF